MNVTLLSFPPCGDRYGFTVMALDFHLVYAIADQCAEVNAR
jgi:hypothetical protein